MTQTKIARLTGSLLARKGEAKPAASVIDFNVSGMFNRPVEIPRGTPATHPVAAPDTARPAAGDPFWDRPGEEQRRVHRSTTDPDMIPDPEALLRQLSNHTNFQPLDSMGTPSESVSESSQDRHPSKRHALTVRLDPDRYQCFKTMAQVGGRSNQEILLDALNHYLDVQTPGSARPDDAEPILGGSKLRNDEIESITTELGAIRALVEKLLDERHGYAGIEVDPPCPTI